MINKRLSSCDLGWLWRGLGLRCQPDRRQGASGISERVSGKGRGVCYRLVDFVIGQAIELEFKEATEYRNLPLAVIIESATNARRIVEDAAFKERVESIRSQGVHFPHLCGPAGLPGTKVALGCKSAMFCPPDGRFLESEFES